MSLNKSKKEIDKGESFMSFMKQKEQKIELLSLIVFYVLLYFIFKYVYPFPGGTSDSGGYVAAAMRGNFDGYRPYGYSNFLDMLHSISESVNLVVLTQYVLNAISSIFIVFTIKYFFKPAKKSFYYVFLVLAIGSFITISLTNNILSDSLFTSLSLLWLTLCFWFAKSTKAMHQLILLAIKFAILYIIMNVRYTGSLFFGLELVLILFSLFKHRKLLALAASGILLFIYIGFYRGQVEVTKNATGVEIFSGFSGWLSVNAALHVTPYVELDKRRIKNKSFAEFYEFMKPMDTVLVKNKTMVGYMWSNTLAPKKYMFYTKQKNQWTYIKSWTYVSKIYDEFGKYVMTKYPFKYFRYYLLPNSYGLFYPQKDEIYHVFKGDALTVKELKWYGIEDVEVVTTRSEFIHKLYPLFPIFRSMLYLLGFIAVIMLFLKKLWRQMSRVQTVLLLFTIVLLGLFITFHAYAAPFCLRYIVPVHILQVALLYIIANELVKLKNKDASS